MAVTAVIGCLVVLGACARSGAQPSTARSGAQSSTAGAGAQLSTAGAGAEPSAVAVAPSAAARGTIPATAAAAVVVFDDRGLGVVTEKDEYGPVTIADAARVTQVATLINSAKTQVPGAHFCPNDTGGGMQVDFRASPAGPSLAVVSISTSGCPGMTVRPAAGPPVVLVGGADVVTQFESILGLPWPKPRQ